MNTLNPILEQVLNDRNGHYVHAFEVNTVEDLQVIIESLCYEFEEYDHVAIADFINSGELYCLDENNEDEVYNFDIGLYVMQCLL